MIDALISLGPALSVAIGAALVTFFAPCAYPLLPGYVGFYVASTDGKQTAITGSVVRGLAAAVGALAVLTALAGVTTALSQTILTHLTLLEQLVGLALATLGIIIILERDAMLSQSVPLPARRSSVFGFALFGGGYALAAAGCVSPVFLGVVLQATSLSPAGAGVVLGAYAGTVALLLLALTVAVGTGVAANAGRLAAHAGTVKRLAGVLLVLAGVGQFYLATVGYDVVAV